MIGDIVKSRTRFPGDPFGGNGRRGSVPPFAAKARALGVFAMAASGQLIYHRDFGSPKCRTLRQNAHRERVRK